MTKTCFVTSDRWESERLIQYRGHVAGNNGNQ